MLSNPYTTNNEILVHSVSLFVSADYKQSTTKFFQIY